MTPRATPSPLPAYDIIELLRQSVAGLAPQDMISHLIDRVEGRK